MYVALWIQQETMIHEILQYMIFHYSWNDVFSLCVFLISRRNEKCWFSSNKIYNIKSLGVFGLCGKKDFTLSFFGQFERPNWFYLLCVFIIFYLQLYTHCISLLLYMFFRVMLFLFAREHIVYHFAQIRNITNNFPL